jgi:hypothetical protein
MCVVLCLTKEKIFPISMNTSDIIMKINKSGSMDEKTSISLMTATIHCYGFVTNCGIIMDAIKYV